MVDESGPSSAEMGVVTETPKAKPSFREKVVGLFKRTSAPLPHNVTSATTEAPQQVQAESLPVIQPSKEIQNGDHQPDSAVPSPQPTLKPELPEKFSGYTKQEIREFSRSTEEGRQARQETARKILEERERETIKDERITEQQDRVSTKQQEMVQAHSEVERINQEIQTIRAELNRRETSLVLRAVEFISPKVPSLKARNEDLEQSTLPRAQNEEDMEEARLWLLRNDYQKLVKEKEALDGGKLTQTEFYKTYGRLLEERQREARNKVDEARRQVEVERAKDEFGQLEALAGQENVYFVHAIRPDIQGGQLNVALSREATWEDKLSVCESKKPTLPCSTIRRGHPTGLWGDLGIVLRQGRVETATKLDAKSRVAESGIRANSNQSYNGEQYRSNLVDVLRNPRNSGYWDDYNELNISRPEIAGIFLDLDSGYSAFRDGKIMLGKPVRWPSLGQEPVSEIPYGEIFRVAQEYGMRVFVFKKGVAYEASVDKKGSLVIGLEMTPQAMVEQTYQIPDANRPKIAERAERNVAELAAVL